MSDNTPTITFNISEKTAREMEMQFFLAFNGSGNQHAHEFYMAVYGHHEDPVTVTISREAAEDLIVMFVMTAYDPEDVGMVETAADQEMLYQLCIVMSEALNDPRFSASEILRRWAEAEPEPEQATITMPKDLALWLIGYAREQYDVESYDLPDGQDTNDTCDALNDIGYYVSESVGHNWG